MKDRYTIFNVIGIIYNTIQNIYSKMKKFQVPLPGEIQVVNKFN